MDDGIISSGILDKGALEIAFESVVGSVYYAYEPLAGFEDMSTLKHTTSSASEMV